MNAELATPPLSVQDAQSAISLFPNPPTHAANPGDKPLHRKVAKLPSALLNLVNTLMDDNHSNREILLALAQSTNPPLPYPINEMDLSRWRAGGYLRYVAVQERLQMLQLDRQIAHEFVANDQTTTLPEATLQIIASHYYQVLGDFNPECLKAKLAEDPLKYTRFLNVFVRLTREILLLKKDRAESAMAVSSKLKELDHNRELNEVEDNAIRDKWDAAFKRRRRPGANQGQVTPPPITNGSSLPVPTPAAIPHNPNPADPPRPAGPLPLAGESDPQLFGNLLSSATGSAVANATGNAAEVPSSLVGPLPSAGAPDSESLANPTNTVAGALPANVASQAVDESISATPTPIPTLGVPEPDSASLSSSATSTNHDVHVPTPSPEHCHCCHAPVPPLLPDGQRPQPNCPHCNTALRPPALLHLYCPSCQGRIAQDDDHLAQLETCPQCHFPLHPR